jgi:hypothetical protein
MPTLTEAAMQSLEREFDQPMPAKVPTHFMASHIGVLSRLI